MFRLTDDPPQTLHLHQLAFHHLLRQSDEKIEDSEVLFLESDFKRLHVEPVASQDAFGISPFGIRRRAAAARERFIDDIVVYQRGGVDDLNDRSQPYCALTVVSAQFCREQKQRRANALSPTLAQIFTD